MSGWIAQMYVYVPGVVKVNWNVAPCWSSSLVKDRSVAETVWSTPSSFVHVTVVPSRTVSVDGEKAKSLMITDVGVPAVVVVSSREDQNSPKPTMTMAVTAAVPASRPIPDDSSRAATAGMNVAPSSTTAATSATSATAACGDGSSPLPRKPSRV